MGRPSAGPGEDVRRIRQDAPDVSTLLVVRHAHAGDREAWEGPDEVRPLSKRGRHQAAGLIEVLAVTGLRVGRIVSSHYVRCLETVVPLACHTRRSIEVHPALAEGSSVSDLHGLVAEVAEEAPAGATVLCTHGDVIWNLLAGPLHDDVPMAKGSTWVVDVEDGRVAAARYLPPPT